MRTASSKRSRRRTNAGRCPTATRSCGNQSDPSGLITPWNWPINQIALKVLPALATGCPAILKPSEHTPLSAQIYAEILHDAGVPAGAFRADPRHGAEVGDALARHPGLAMISFTGSTRGGVSVMKAAADSVKRVTLELGGKSPNLVFADCGEALAERVRASVAECFLNTGQSCDAPTRLIVEAACYEDVVEMARAAAEDTQVGDPRKPRATISARSSMRSSGTVCRR
jgi:aldehyde dehydrogenase (NAD+)